MDKIYDDKPIVINETYVGYGKTDLSEMNKSEFIIWLYEEKDKLDEALHKDHVNGTYRDECWAKVNLLDKIIAKAKKEL